jgi:phage tail sheath gpL-like
LGQEFELLKNSSIANQYQVSVYLLINPRLALNTGDMLVSILRVETAADLTWVKQHVEEIISRYLPTDKTAKEMTNLVPVALAVECVGEGGHHINPIHVAITTHG